MPFFFSAKMREKVMEAMAETDIIVRKSVWMVMAVMVSSVGISCCQKERRCGKMATDDLWMPS